MSNLEKTFDQPLALGDVVHYFTSHLLFANDSGVGQRLSLIGVLDALTTFNVNSEWVKANSELIKSRLAISFSAEQVQNLIDELDEIERLQYYQEKFQSGGTFAAGEFGDFEKLEKKYLGIQE